MSKFSSKLTVSILLKIMQMKQEFRAAVNISVLLSIKWVNVVNLASEGGH
jgi:predicted fused transcriptional regulator/phosphomethylpyrimidine kinase